MIGRWLRRRWWDFEDAITDALDWQPSPAPPLKPLPPAPPKEPHQHVNYSFTSVGFQRATPEQADAEMLQLIFREMAKNTFFEIRY